MHRLTAYSLYVACILVSPGIGQERAAPESDAPLVSPTVKETVAPVTANNGTWTINGLSFFHPSSLSNTEQDDFLKLNMRIRGRIETDAIVAVQSRESQEILGDLQNGYGFRRLRLGSQGTLGDALHWVSEVELAGGTPRLRDVFIGYTMFPWVRELRVGFFREPFSLEGNTSANFITFMERSPLNELDPTRNWGGCAYWWPDDERATFALGLFRDGTTSGGQSQGDEDAWAVTGRVTALPVYDSDENNFRLLHLGIAASFRTPSGGIVRFDPGLASSLLTVSDDPASPFLPTITIPAVKQQLLNLQAAWVNQSLSMQSEWFATLIQQPNAGTVFFHGFYFDVSYFLTGEHRGYDLTRGAFDQVKVLRPVTKSKEDPRGGMGAIELAGRFSFTDFSSPNLAPLDNGLPAGAFLYQLTLGCNWYLNDFTRFMFNYTAGIPKEEAQDATVAHLFSIRFAFFW